MLLMRRLCSSFSMGYALLYKFSRDCASNVPCAFIRLATSIRRGQLLFALLRVFGKLILKRLIFTLGVAILSRKITRILFAVSVFGTLIAIPSHSVEIIKIHKFLRTFNI